ncbi:coiled-coil domain-containing protein 138 [Xenopus tropicalis]|uniref:Coiled-coil domain-containing protein 138 n=1 Tax=Xenopus tropicalis TaxID=8364 RepID=B1H2Q9_XENTR|nr:coiled-coil domain-containing protein 138 [Xenopus tropicalis]AAI61093.1 LOC100145464 protein [Xenopus tropicalis]|eukprot:NP_001120388.1 coiled-coil domain-containing protein 138 [Xenopus tropicalis]
MPVSPNCSAALIYTQQKYYTKAFKDLLKVIQDSGWNDNRSSDSSDSSELETDEEQQAVYQSQDIGTHLYTNTDVTLPSYLVANTCTEPSVEATAVGKHNSRKSQSSFIKGTNSLPPEVADIYEELCGIYQKLQQERLSQQEYSLQLKKREKCLQQKEEMLFKHQTTLSKIKGFEEIVHAKLRIMKEQHNVEMKQLSNALKEKAKENKRLKSSFDTLKEMNDALKKQLNEVSEQNKQLEMQARKVQARLENLQRKQAFQEVQKCKEVSQATQYLKPKQTEKASVSMKLKVPHSVQVYELLTVLMDWISDVEISNPKSEENGSRGKSLCINQLPANYVQEKCAKILPVVVEQFQLAPLLSPKLQFSLIKFAYWILRQLGKGSQSTMASTLRRLGEDTFKGVTYKPTEGKHGERAADNKIKLAAFYKSNNFSLRFLSTLIVLKTVTQVDYLAQALDTLCMDLKSDEGRELFVEYDAVEIVLKLLHLPNRCLISSVLDILLQLSMEPRFFEPFVENCSNEAFFKNAAALLRDPKSDVPVLEKLSVVLQKLSKIKSNKKYFELFNIPQQIQEIQRSANPDHAFLVINLNSVLFHLGYTKCSILSSSANTNY